MNIQEKIKEYLLDNDHHVNEVAHEVEGILYDYESGAISKEMRDELLKDVLELAKTKSEMESLETKTKIANFVRIVEELAGFL